MNRPKLGLLIIIFIIFSQYTMGQENWVLNQERLDPLGLKSENGELNIIREGKFTLEQKGQGEMHLLGEQLKEQNKWMDGTGAIVPMVQEHFILGKNWPAASTFHVVVIGDSIAWGCGLNQDKKYSYLVADWLKGMLESSVDVTVLAHTGATLEEPKNIEKKHNFLDPELGSWDPTIWEQVERISNPEDVDLILISGGINDVGVNTILNPLTSSNDINTACASIQEPMSTILINLLNKCPKSKIVLTSYFPIVSEDTPESALNDFAKKLSIDHPDILTRFGASLVNENPSTKNTIETKIAALVLDAAAFSLMRDNSKKFDSQSRISLSGAVDSANEYARSNFHEDRIVFAPVNFPSYASYGTSKSWLWMLTDIENGGKTNDHKYAYRTSLCDITYRPTCTMDDMIEAIYNPNTPSPCGDYLSTCYWDDKISAIGHPNVAGANEYARAIETAITSKGPNWLDNSPPTVQNFQLTPSSISSGESIEIAYSVSDSGGSGLKQAELWRKAENEDWPKDPIQTKVLANENGLIDSFTDTPAVPGKYWYGVHVVDNAGNWNDERNANTKNVPGIYGPIEVTVIKAKSTVIPTVDEHLFNITILNSAGTRVDGARIVIDGLSSNTTDNHGELAVVLKDGYHIINASKSGYGIGNWSKYLNHTLTNSINITLLPIPKYLFTIITINSAGIPLSGSEIRVNNVSKGHSGPNGNLSIELINGNYAIKANKPGYGTGNWSGILDNRTNTVAVVKLNGTLEYPFKIIALNSAGFLLEGTNVSIDGRESGVTDQHGEIIAMLTESQHIIEAVKADYGSRNWTGILDYNKSHEVQITLNGPLEYPFNITVINAANYSIEGAIVSLADVKKGVTDKAGRLRTFLPEGNQTLRAAKEYYGSANWTGELNHADGKDIEIRINGAMEYPFNVTVVNSAGNMIQDANVSVDGRFTGITDIDGYFKAMITDGTHTIEANKTGYDPGKWTALLNFSLNASIPLVLNGSTLIEDMQPIDLCLVLDTSGSMADSACSDLSKIQAVKDAAQDTIASFFYPGTSNRVAIVSFCHYPTTVQGFTNNYRQAYDNVSNIYPDGATSFGAGLFQAIEEFKKINQSGHVREIIFMSDGMHNTAPGYEYYLALCRIMGIRVYTVGYGSEADHGLLKDMAALSGGEYVFADPCGDKERGIRYMFMRQQMNLSGSNPSINASGVVAQNETVNATYFEVPVGSKYLTAELLYPGSHLKLNLIGPDGKLADPKEYIYTEDKRVITVRLKDPKPGKWMVQVYGDQVNGTEPYTIYVSPRYVAPTAPAVSFKSIVIKEKSGETLKEYPIRISFNPRNFPAKSKADGSDINIFDQNAKDLPRWIEKWDTKEKKGDVWVKIPEIPADGEVRLMMLTGNPGEPAANNGSQIFDFFDDFEDGIIDANRWYVYNNSSSRVDESNGTLHISADARSFSSAGIRSYELFKPNITMRFLANASEGQSLDRKGMGFLTDSVGENEIQIAEGVYWRGQEKNMWPHHKFILEQGSGLSSGYNRVEAKYGPGYRTWEIQWLDSLIRYMIDDIGGDPQKSLGMPKEAIGIGFSINTSVQTMPSDIFLDWVFAYECASSNPDVKVESDLR